MHESLYTSHRITPHLAWTTALSCLGTLQFGYHLAVLNAPQQILSCQMHIPGPFPSYLDTFWGRHGFDQCISLDSQDIAWMNTMFTVGGLLSSTIAGSHTVASICGRRNMQILCAGLYAGGSVIFALSNSFGTLNAGRFLSGLGAGASMVVSPVFISEISPFNHRGLMGSLLQFGVAIGILLAQLIALLWGNDQQWRMLFVFGTLMALFQFVFLFSTVESPKWLIMHRGEISRASDILQSLRSNVRATKYEIHHWRRLSTTQTGKAQETLSLLEDPVNQETQTNVGDEDSQPEDGFYPLSTAMSGRGSIDPSTLSLQEYFTSRRYRREIIATAIIMTAQQLCGMNAITFYGVSVLSNIVPNGTNVLLLTCSLALCNVVLALAISPFIDRWNRKSLLLLSVSTMAFCSVLIAGGIVNGLDILAAVACFGFIIGFSIGLCQIPFLMVSEFCNHETISKSQSFGTMLNWLANIAIACMFPLLRSYLGGYTFLLFTAIGIFYLFAIVWWVPETKGKLNYADIWNKDELP